MNTNEKIEEIELRLRTVERSARRWRALAMLAAAVTIGIGTLGAAANRAARVVDVEGIRFVDKEGANRGFIGINDEGQPTLIFRDAKSEDRVYLGFVDDQPVVSLFGSGDSGMAVLKMDENGGMVGVYGAGKSEIISGFADNSSGVRVIDSEGNHRSSLGIEDEKAKLSLQDSDGNLRFAVEATKDRTLMMLADFKSGNREAVLETRPGVGGTLALYDEHGDAYFIQQPNE